MFTTDFGVVHSVNCLTRSEIAFNADRTALNNTRWRQTDRAEVHFKGYNEARERSEIFLTWFSKEKKASL